MLEKGAPNKGLVVGKNHARHVHRLYSFLFSQEHAPLHWLLFDVALPLSSFDEINPSLIQGVWRFRFV